MSDADAVNLIFISGLSTAEKVSETSGRGVGMDAVKTAVEAMKGSIEIETREGRGTTFRMRLPLTLAVIKALLFEVSGRLYAVPVPVIAEVAKIRSDDLVTVDGKATLLLRDQIISIIKLSDLFRVEGNGSNKKFVLILGSGREESGTADRQGHVAAGVGDQGDRRPPYAVGFHRRGVHPGQRPGGADSRCLLRVQEGGRG